MKSHTQDFKEMIKTLGKQQDVLIEYKINNVDYTLTVEEINSVTPVYESNILKSVMKELDLDSNVKIPKGTEINFKYGIYINNTVEYLDYGKYIVFSCEKQEDTNSYNIVCYDRLLESMKDYEPINLSYPVTVRTYLTALAGRLGLEFKNSNDIFPNYDKQIASDLFVDLGYKYRDVLDDLAEVTASVICLDSDEKLELRDINDTEDTIDEEFLNDTDVNFNEEFGPINSIVLSRSSSDNIYKKDDESIEANGLCEIKISDNQIMNFNDRSNYLEDIYNKLHGLTYTIFDFCSTGVMYYDLLDRFNVKVKENIYSCVLFNDEQDITQGLEEHMYTEKPETSETDYSKADKTDQKINQTNLIVDKQQQTITGLITQNGEFENKLTQVEQTVEGIAQTVEDTIDYKRSLCATTELHLENAAAQEPLSLEIQGNKTYPTNLYPRRKCIS